jgi:hypothetical protein
MKGGNFSILSKVPLAEGLPCPYLEPTHTPSVLTIRKDPPWSIKNAVAKASFPYRRATMGKPRKEVLASPQTKIKHPVKLLLHWYFFPTNPKMHQESKKVSHAAAGASPRFQESCKGGIWSRARAGSTR